MLVELTPMTFSESMGTDFEIVDNPANLFSIKLTHITEHVKTELQESFSLFFEGSSDVFLPQGTYRLKHSKLGVLEIFLVPVGRSENGFQYEALFNHIFR